jgi:hypothetical protein
VTQTYVTKGILHRPCSAMRGSPLEASTALRAVKQPWLMLPGASFAVHNGIRVAG